MQVTFKYKDFYKHEFVVYLVWMMIVVLCAYVALNSYGYDDEYYNIRMIREHDLNGLLHTIQGTDIHPPLSYFLNKSFFSIVHDWSLVRLISVIFYATALFYFLAKTPNGKSKILWLLFIGFNPTIILWITSIRWYAYVIPLLICLHVIPDYLKKYYWWRFFFICLIICFLGYIGIVLTAIYFLLYWINDKNSWQYKLKRIGLPAFLFAVVYAYQIWLLFSVHTKEDLTHNQQRFDFFTSLLSYVSSVFGNQGLFPLSLFGLISMLGMGIVVLYAILYLKQNFKENKWMLAFLALSVFFIVSGFAGKIRNLVLIEPLRVSFFTTLHKGRTPKILLLGFFLIFIGNISGTYNVVAHQQTSKNAWNLNIPETLKLLNQQEQKGGKTIYFTHHPSFAYHLNVAGKEVVSFYNSLYFDSASIKMKVTDLDTMSYPYDVVFIINYRGQSIFQSHYERMLSAMKFIESDSIKYFSLERDPLHRIKRKFFPDYPEYATKIIWYKGVKNNGGKLNVWGLNE